MSDLRDLYQSVILDHNKKPRNQRRPEGANHDADGFNPLCGDKICVYVEIEGDVVKDIGFEGSGCAISTASASLMTETVKGRSLDEAQRLFEGFHGLVTGPPMLEPDTAGLGKLAVFSGVREFPIRVKCATLAWHTLRSAIEGGDATATTE